MRRSSQASGIQPTICLPPAIGHRISTPGAAWAWLRQSVSVWRWRGPTFRVIVLDGDGSLLMNLGSLATIGLVRPVNLVVVVMGQRGIRDDRRPGRQRRRTAPISRQRPGHWGLAPRRRCAAKPNCETHWPPAVEARRNGGRRPARLRPGAVDHRRQGKRIGADGQAAARLCVHQAAFHGGDRQSRGCH